MATVPVYCLLSMSPLFAQTSLKAVRLISLSSSSKGTTLSLWSWGQIKDKGKGISN